MTFGQEMERVNSYNPEANTGQIPRWNWTIQGHCFA